MTYEQVRRMKDQLISAIEDLKKICAGVSCMKCPFFEGSGEDNLCPDWHMLKLEEALEELKKYEEKANKEAMNYAKG